LASSYGLRSTGLVVFTGRIISAFTGLLFTFMAARWLSVSGFGNWEVIVTLVTFSSYPVGVVAYWATRDVARGRMVGRTAFFSGTLLSGLGLVLYFGFTFVTQSTIATSILPFLLGGLLVPLSYWSAVANSIVQGFRPGLYAYSLVISELAKLAVAYEALFVLRAGIEGVIVALMAAYLVQSLVSTYFVRLTASERFDFSQTRRWSRLAWIPAISYLPTVLAVADSYVAALGFGYTIVGYYQVAFIVASVIGYSSSISFSLYPLLLRGGDERLPSLSIDFALMFSIPLAVGCIILSTPILFLMGSGSRYLPGATGLSILGAMFVFTALSVVIDQTLLGTEKADLAERPSFWSLLRSNLLYVPVVNTLYGVVYLVTLYLSLSYATSNAFSESSMVAVWASAQTAATLVFLLVKARRARRYAKLSPGISAAYYLVAGAAMAAVLYVLYGFANVQTGGTLTVAARLIAVGVAGLVVYGGILYILDPKFRDLARSLRGRLPL
jgi:O-antigen/teichoic acid export membrane protein